MLAWASAATVVVLLVKRQLKAQGIRNSQQDDLMR